MSNVVKDLMARPTQCSTVGMCGVIFFCHLPQSSVELYEEALQNTTATGVPVFLGGRSSVYVHEARSLRSRFGSVVNGLKAVYLDESPEWVGLASYSAGYGMVREALKDKEHGIQLVVSIDSIYADKDPDGTASDRDLESFVTFAREAREGNGVFWLGHGDIPVRKYASTTKVAEELRRLVGGAQNGLRIEAFDVAKNEGVEHHKALVEWGPIFLLGAVEALEEQRLSYIY